MVQKHTAKFGSWKSPISAKIVASGSRSFQQIAVDGDAVYWVETRPDEGGRYVIMSDDGNGAKTITPDGFSVRNSVNSYGGASFMVHKGIVYFSNYQPKEKQQNFYRQEPGEAPVAITDAGNTGYADAVYDRTRERIICVRESDTETLNGQPKQVLVALDPQGENEAVVLTEGMDFYAAPRISPDGTKIAWICWNYPSMPWDGTQLYTATFSADGTLWNIVKVAGDPIEGKQPEGRNPVFKEALEFSDQSIMQPKWSPEGSLHFISDAFAANGERWWSLYRQNGGEIEHLTPLPMEIGGPAWNLGGSDYDFTSDGEIVFSYTNKGKWGLVRLGKDGAKPVKTISTAISQIHTKGEDLCMIAGGFDTPASIVSINPQSGAAKTIRQSVPDDEMKEIADYLAAPTFISFPTTGGGEAHAFHYAPQNPRYEGEEGEKPPLLIFVHGGPSASVSEGLQMRIQYFTSRGFAVLDMAYRGSTGFGRNYHQSLYGNWGVYDIEDCVAGADFLGKKGLVDEKRIASRGGSSGGYTTLALATFTKKLCAAVSYYGISNLEMIATLTNKLEARYAELLIAPYPESAEIFKQRSPYFEAKKLTTPLLIFQGCDDPVVPPPQAKVMIRELLDEGLPVAYEFFPSESHGFRIQENIIKCAEAELSFYSSLMGFDVPEELYSVKLFNYPESTTKGKDEPIDDPCPSGA